MKKDLVNIVRHAEVSEKAIEQFLANRVKRMGGVCLKYSNPGMVGYPDRVCLLPGGVTIWIELKSQGKHLMPAQRIRKAQMENMGHPVYVCDSKLQVELLLKQYERKQ